MSRKARWLLIGGLWALVLLTGIDRGWTMGTEEVVAKVQKVYEETRTFKAAFVQETFVRSAKKTIRERDGVLQTPGPHALGLSPAERKADDLVSNKDMALYPSG